MKNTLHFILAGFCLITISATAQNQYVSSANNQLRNIFSQITYPDPDVDFLYERSVKFADSVFYDNLSNGTLNPETWFQLYSEMYYAAHDTTSLSTADDIWNISSAFSPDTIPMLLMDFDYYHLKPNALNTNTWFIFDTINNVLYDNPSAITDPYVRANIFSASPASSESYFSTATFRIEPGLIFLDSPNYSLYTTSGYTLKIDFGDGNGWVTVNPFTTTDITVTYPDSGDYVITTALFDPSGETMKRSFSSLRVTNPSPPVIPDGTIDLPGMTVGTFNSCVSPAEQKAIIYLEGYDMADMIPAKSRGINQIYSDMIDDSRMANLRNFGYTFYVVNWKNSRIDMRFNALYLVNLIEYIKSNSANKHQIVIVGESMGGVIARYALTYMESPEYVTGDFSPFLVEVNDSSSSEYVAMHPELYQVGFDHRHPNLINVRHNTRLLITLDSPHQGANIPLSVQYLYKIAMDKLPFGSIQGKLTEAFNLGLSGKAARQLLLYHISTGSGYYSSYGPDPSYTTFFTQLKDMGDYPAFTKLVAQSSGNLSGMNQENSHGGLRTVNDKIFTFNFTLYGRLIYQTIPFFKTSLGVNTNPNGSGQFFTFNAGKWLNFIKLKWFGVNVNSIYLSLYYDARSGSNLKPYSISAGGYWGSIKGLNYSNGTYNLSNKWILNLFSYSTINQNGCINFGSHAGINGLASINLDIDVCSDGFHFNFVPIQSALDYGKGITLPLNHNIQAENINTKLSRTPFDVIIGYTGNNPNAPHLRFRNEDITNLSGIGQCYYSNSNLPGCRPRSLLNLEIGDEELYLENLNLNYEADYQTEFDIHVNDRNSYYYYPSGPGSILAKVGYYSKEKPFTVSSGGQANFHFDSQASPSSTPGFTHNPPFVTNLTQTDVPLYICNVEFRIKNDSNQKTSEKSRFQIYPNPSTKKFHLDCQNCKDSEYSIYSIDGKLILKGRLSNELSSFELNAPPGIYYFISSVNGELKTHKLILQ